MHTPGADQAVVEALEVRPPPELPRQQRDTVQSREGGGVITQELAFGVQSAGKHPPPPPCGG